MSEAKKTSKNISEALQDHKVTTKTNNIEHEDVFLKTNDEAPKKTFHVSDAESGIISRTSSRENEVRLRKENWEKFNPEKEEELRKKSEEYVRGKFVFTQRPGDTLKFPFKEFKGQDCVQYALKDGEIYTLPLGVAQHINKRVAYPIHEHTSDARKPFRVKQMVNRASFHIYEFVERNDNSFNVMY